MKLSHAAICPFLNWKDDKTLRFRFSHPRNYCFKPEAPQPIHLNHQEIFCLDPKYIECPVFLSKRIGDLPERILAKKLQKKFALPLKEILFTIVLIIGTSLLVFFNIRLQQNSGLKSQGVERTTTSNEKITTTDSIISDEKHENNISQISEGISPFPMPSFIENREKLREETINYTRIPVTGHSLHKPNRYLISGNPPNSVAESFKDFENKHFFELHYLEF